MCMYRQGTYCLMRINRALRKPVQWEINMTQGQLLLRALLPVPKKEAAYLTLGLFWVIYLSFHLFYYLLFFAMHLSRIAYANNNKKYVQLSCLGHIFLKIKQSHLSSLPIFFAKAMMNKQGAYLVSSKGQISFSQSVLIQLSKQKQLLGCQVQ